MNGSGADPSRARLDAEILAWMKESPIPLAADEARFERLSREVFGFHFAHCEAYGRCCRARGSARFSP